MLSDDERKEQLSKELRNGWREDSDFVFVSYSSRDWEKVYPTIIALRKRGFNVYIDTELQEVATKNWMTNVRDILFRAEIKGVISFLSINYMRSYACMLELLMSHSHDMERDRGEFLPVIYIALEKEMGTLQGMQEYIRKPEIRSESKKLDAKMQMEERTILEKTILNCKIQGFDKEDVVSDELDEIKDRHQIATLMEMLCFKDSIPIQRYKTAEECAEMLERNFTNTKNTDISLKKHPELMQKEKTKVAEKVTSSEKNNEINNKNDASEMPHVNKENTEKAIDNTDKKVVEKSTIEEHKPKKEFSVTGDITFTLYGNEYTRNQSDMMLTFFAQVLKHHQDKVAELPEYKGMNCASHIDYTKKENRNDDMPSYFRNGKYFSFDNGEGVCIGTSYSASDKLKKMALLLEICGESRDIFMSEQIELPELKKEGAQKGETSRGNASSLEYSVYGSTYTGSQSEMMGNIFYKVLNRHTDCLEQVEEELNCVALSDMSLVNKEERASYFNVMNVYEIAGQKISIGGAYSMDAKLSLIARLLDICDEPQSILSISGYQLPEKKSGRRNGRKKENIDYMG